MIIATLHGGGCTSVIIREGSDRQGDCAATTLQKEKGRVTTPAFSPTALGTQRHRRRILMFFVSSVINLPDKLHGHPVLIATCCGAFHGLHLSAPRWIAVVPTASTNR